jgi:hypothetical protein
MRAPPPTLTVILTIALLAAPLFGDAQPAETVHRIGYVANPQFAARHSGKGCASSGGSFVATATPGCRRE